MQGLSPELITGAAGILVSLIFTYVPGLRVKYASLATEYKSLIMLGALALVSGFIVLSSCLDWWVFIECSKNGFLKLVEVFILSLVANQAAYVVAPQPGDVRAAKDAR